MTTPRPWFYSRATVEILLFALREAEAAAKREREPKSGRYCVVAPRVKR